MPSRWVVPANGNITVRLRFMAVEPGEYDEVLNIKIAWTQKIYQLHSRCVACFPSVSHEPRYVRVNIYTFIASYTKYGYTRDVLWASYFYSAYGYYSHRLNRNMMLIIHLWCSHILCNWHVLHTYQRFGIFCICLFVLTIISDLVTLNFCLGFLLFYFSVLNWNTILKLDLRHYNADA